MRFVDIIEKKKDNQTLTPEEINFWIAGLIDNTIPDYQSSALLMAIVLNGMDPSETAALTEAMVKSGKVFDLSKISGIKVDKHSTGGVGDKTTLALAPLVAACQGKIAKMSGRGLGHTGGTLDKLESISGYNINLSEAAFINQVNKINIALIGQTDNLVYADKVLYALRDVTATVASIPLIASSIMSKKIASGADAILLDVKYGDGAFMNIAEDALNLANTMIEIGERLGKKVKAMITSMEQPLGFAIGNALEVKEAIATLKGEGPADFVNLIKVSAALMLELAEVVQNQEEAMIKVDEAFKSESALNKLVELVKAQGGNPNQILNPELLPKAKFISNILSEKSGYIASIKASVLGHQAMLLGAGRLTKDDKINYGVGIILKRKIGEYVEKGDVIAEIHHDNDLTSEFIARFLTAYSFNNESPKPEPLIYQVI